MHCLRDLTRGGLASALNEIAAARRVGIELDERRDPVPEPGRRPPARCWASIPLYVANEGVLVAFVAAGSAAEALAALRAHPLGAEAALVGRVVGAHPGMVALRTGLGGLRVVDMLPGDQLPRIC